MNAIVIAQAPHAVTQPPALRGAPERAALDATLARQRLDDGPRPRRPGS